MPMAASISPPPLRDGDRLSRDEFMRRWEAMPDLRWAELIDGIVYMPSPISDIHMDFHARMSGWLWFYATLTPGCVSRPAGTWLMAPDSAPQPDVALKILPDHGGQSTLEGEYAAGAPELIVEVSHTTAARDTGVKLRLYERSGVREYVVVRPRNRKLAWHVLADRKYQRLEAGEGSLYRSHVFPGLWLDLEQLWKGDFAGMAETVRQGTATPEHAAFVRQLAERKR